MRSKTTHLDGKTRNAQRSNAQGASGEQPAPSERDQRVRSRMARPRGESTNTLLAAFEEFQNELDTLDQDVTETLLMQEKAQLGR
ncbi:MAG: hypothetical protein KJ587_10310 [Alphaproteobacteria bacterium]|nr:hypothetical protein [Alphaproteobacteria bacterium]